MGVFRKFTSASEPAGVRAPAVAGQFYPGDPERLRRDVTGFITAAKAANKEVPKAVIAPHAGYQFSGPIAGSAYACLAQGRNSLKRVLLLGPSHFVAFRGLAASSAITFQTPLGTIPVDREALDQARALAQVTVLDAAHRNEHSLEVHLPFLQVALAEFMVVPLVVGEATPREVGEVLNRLWDGDQTCIVVSSDLSHYLDYEASQETDHHTARVIESLQWEELDSDRACGCRPICGLLNAAKEQGMQCRAVDLRNSGDTSGDRDRVVGYGAFVFTQN